MIDEPELFGMPEDEESRRQLLEHAGDDVSQPKWSKTLAEYVQVLEQLYLRRGMPEDQAFRLAADSVLELAEQRGGRVEYLPRGDSLRTALRHAEIYRRCNGVNHQALADEYGLTVPQIYRINRQQRSLYLKRAQGGLFPTEG